MLCRAAAIALRITCSPLPAGEKSTIACASASDTTACGGCGSVQVSDSVKCAGRRADAGAEKENEARNNAASTGFSQCRRITPAPLGRIYISTRPGRLRKRKLQERALQGVRGRKCRAPGI